MTARFLGRGWKFPVEVDAATGTIALSDGESDIRESIWIILSTAKGERVMRPDFGCGIHDLVFDSMSAATVVDESIVERDGIHIGVAVETERGLVVPVVRNADHFTITGLADAIETIARKARDRKLVADDLQGGTFTVSNPGRQGNLYGFAIINQPQVGILRMGEIAKRAVVRTLDGEDAIVIRTMMYMALSYDHRAVDGAPANGFLYRIRELLEAGDFDL